MNVNLTEKLYLHKLYKMKQIKCVENKYFAMKKLNFKVLQKKMQLVYIPIRPLFRS